jgi:hypothetical protein
MTDRAPIEADEDPVALYTLEYQQPVTDALVFWARHDLALLRTERRL